MTDLAVPFAYPGGKARIADQIVALMPPHRVYVEPFAGALAVLLAKPRSAVELISDTNGELINFWRMLRERPDDLAAACALTLYARAEYDHAFDGPATDDPIERARRFWTKVHQGVAHKLGSRSGWQVGLGSGTGVTPKSATTLRKIDGLPPIAKRIAAVMIDYRPAVETIPMMDAPDALHYCDPPYVADTHNQDGAYPDVMTDADHRDLAAVLHGCDGTVLLSGYKSALYDDLFADWPYVDLPGRADTANRAGAAIGRTERLWSNRPLRTAGTLFDCPLG